MSQFLGIVILLVLLVFGAYQVIGLVKSIKEKRKNQNKDKEINE